MSSQFWKLNEQEYFEAPGLSLLMFHDFYPEGKQGGIELIQHGVRVITNGDVRLERAPLQWSRLPKTGSRQVDRTASVVTLPMQFPELEYSLRVWAEQASIHIAVDLSTPLPLELDGKAGLNIEILPAPFFGKTYHLGDTQGIFPRQANGPFAKDADGVLIPEPLARGKVFSAAPEDPLHWIMVERLDGELYLLDGRNLSQDNWFVLRAPLTAGKTQGAVELVLHPHSRPGWRRPPVLLHSQVGYHPDQEKRLLVELEPPAATLGDAELVRIHADGSLEIVSKGPLHAWGRFLRYDYAVFDFSPVRDAGMYRLQYAGEVSHPFRIGRDVYQNDVWQPTLETFLPVQMCHMAVRDRYQVWHGACHLDDAIQAPTDHEHFDGYRQSSETETPFKPFEHIPHLNQGGWHDAGDYDLAAGSQAATTYFLALAHETFGLDSDQTSVDWQARQVTLHQPDGVPDIVQQVRHGIENLLSGYRAVGHSFCGIIEGTLQQYTHLGDAATMTDNRVYNPELQPGQIVGESSGARDDRWVFTNRSTALEYYVAGVLAASSRVLRSHYPSLADECLQTARRIWKFEHTHPASDFRAAYVPGLPDVQEFLAAAELFLTTGESEYRLRLLELTSVLEAHPAEAGWIAARVLRRVDDTGFASALEKSLSGYRENLLADISTNPFGVPFHPHVWGCTWNIQLHALKAYYLHKAYPHWFERELILHSLNYVLGWHPASSTSLVSGVGAHSLIPAYGTNRAEWWYIPGGGGSGPNLVRPDFPELKEDFPFLWQQAEYVIGGAATYVFDVLAADALLNGG